MMQGDDIRNHRIEAEKRSADFGPNDTRAHAILALWVIAEQLFEIRQNLGMAIDRKEDN